MFDSITDLAGKLAATGYFIDPVMTQVVFLAAKLQKPLLLEGPAGSGKTQLALSVAAAASTHVERLQCYRGVTEDKAIGRFDEGLQRLYMEFSKGQQENWQTVQANLKGRDFFRPGPLMRALECDRPCVLLIDELDKVDEGFEAMLLEILSAWTLSIPEFGTVSAKSIPFVVLTSNEERRLNFEMSVKMLQQSLSDRERVEKIQGLLNELLSFLEDELSVVTGSYQDLLSLDDVLENDLILFVSLNANRNQRAVEALGKILLQNIQLMVGKRYAQPTSGRDADEPMLSVILDEFASFAYPGFTQVLQTARGARVSFLFSFQSLPQLQRVSQAFADEVSSSPGTKMIMNVSEENTAQWFLKASARIAAKRRSLSVRRTGIFSTKYTETGTGSESEIKETRAREDHIKNLPVGQMEILMVDSREGTRHSHLHVRQAPRFQLEGLNSSLYPKMHSCLDPKVGVNLRFKEAENRKQRCRRTSGLVLDGAGGE